MLIRIKHDGKSRKLPTQVNTVAELRQKIAELFGPDHQNLQIVYKDCDDELVNVFDNEDLQNCYVEAQELKQTSVTFILKSKTNASRSISSKKSSKSSSSSSSDDFKDVEAAPKLTEAPKGAAPVEAPKGAAPAEKPIDILQAEKDRLLAEQAQKQAQLDAQKATQVKTAEVAKEKSNSRSKSPNACKKKAGQIAPFQHLMQKLKFMKRICEKDAIPHPVVLFHEILHELQAECPALACNPELLNDIIRTNKAELSQLIKSGYSKVVAAKPELVEKSKVNIVQWKEFKKKCDEVGEKDANKDYNDKHRGERDLNQAKKRAERELKIAEKLARQEQKQREKEARHAEKDAEKAKKHAEKDAERAIRNAQKDAERAQKGEKHKGRSRSRELTEEEKVIKQKVRAAREVFPKMDKHEIKAIVKQNPTITQEALIETLKNFKRVKSSNKHGYKH